MKYFGVEFRESKKGFYLNKSNYLPAKPLNINKFIPEEYLPKYIEDCLYNFDKNIAFFNSLSEEDFKSVLNSFLNKYKKFVEIEDLNITKFEVGYYLMVLDKYKQVYIGTSDSDIFKRIKRHMVDNQEFYKLLWGTKENSKLSINSFRPLDITRIYVYFTCNTFSFENRFIKAFPEKYLLNRVEGGHTINVIDASIKNIKHKIE